MQPLHDRALSRREWLVRSVAAGATLALTPALLRAMQQPGPKLMQRVIPSSGEKLPVVGLQFRNSRTQDPAALKEVLKTLLDNDATFLDTMHQSMPGVEDLMARVVTELGVQNKLFLGLRANPPGPQQTDPAVLRTQIQSLLTKFKVPKLDLVQLGSNAHPSMFAALQEAKRSGQVRYIAATTIVDERHAELETLMRNEPLDFIGVRYAIDHRSAENLLTVAQERKIAVVAYFPFGVGSLFERAGNQPLPDWAADFDAKTWAQFFIKFVLGHPAVTVVRAGTIQPKHMLDNIGGGIGRLPDEATRKRMADLIDSWPPAKGPAKAPTKAPPKAPTPKP